MSPPFIHPSMTAPGSPALLPRARTRSCQYQYRQLRPGRLQDHGLRFLCLSKEKNGSRDSPQSLSESLPILCLDQVLMDGVTACWPNLEGWCGRKAVDRLLLVTNEKTGFCRKLSWVPCRQPAFSPRPQRQVSETAEPLQEQRINIEEASLMATAAGTVGAVSGLLLVCKE